jgi:putative FmdB family regulatory protein
MPTYDYKCDACEHAFEEFQSMTEEPLKKCPRCKKKKLRRLIGTGAAILFKGSGFYQTDYRSESYKSAAKAAESNVTPAASNGTASDAAKTPAASSTAGGETNARDKTPAKKAKS